MSIRIPLNEKKLAGKIMYEFKRNLPPDSIPKFSITISRQYGCRAYPLALRIKELIDDRLHTDYKIYNQDLDKHVSDVTGISAEYVSKLGDSSQILDFFSSFLPNYLSHAEVYKFIKKEIIKIATRGNSIIIGKGGGVICSDIPTTVNVRMEAPLETRVEYLSKTLNINLKDTKKLIELNERSREKFFAEALKADLGDSNYYDLVIKEGIPIDQMAMTVVDYFLRKRDYVLEKIGLLEVA